MSHTLKSRIKDAKAADKAEGSCYMPHVMSQDSQNTNPQSKMDKCGIVLHFSVLWKNSGK